MNPHRIKTLILIIKLIRVKHSLYLVTREWRKETSTYGKKINGRLVLSYSDKIKFVFNYYFYYEN